MIARVGGYFRHTWVEAAMRGHVDSFPQYSVVQGLLKINLNHPVLLSSIPPHYMTVKINCQNEHQHMPANVVFNSTLPRILRSHGLKGHICMNTMFSDTTVVYDTHKKCKGTTLVYNRHMLL